MTIHDEISQAISAHGKWKQKLRSAINTGQCESTPAKVKKDNNCSFGKWLHGRIDPTHKDSQYYPKIVDLHAKFHQEAGAILELALNGKTDEANSLLGLTSDFAKYSAQLTATMKDWQNSL